MSVKIMGLVWELDIPSSEKLVLLAYADHADHDGTGIYPSVPWVARKTGYSEREVQRLTRKLEDRGLLVPDGTGPRGTNRWRCGVEGGDNLSGVTSEGVTSATGRGDNGTGEGVTPVSPESSLTIKKPSSRGGALEARKEQAEAEGAPMPAGGSEEAYVNRDKIPAHFLPYADTYHDLTGQEPTKRVLHDWLATFSDWAAEGIQPGHVRVAHQESLSRFVVLRPGSLTNMAAACRARHRLHSRKAEDDLRESRLRQEKLDRARARARPMPEEVRRRLDKFFQRNTIQKEAP